MFKWKDIIICVLLIACICCSVTAALKTGVIAGPKGDKGDTGATGATGAKGDKGDTGANGLTPHIGENGNWWIGAQDTGVLAEGQVYITTSYWVWQDFEIIVESIDLLNIHNYYDYFDFTSCSIGNYDSSIEGRLKTSTSNQDVKVSEAYIVYKLHDNNRFNIDGKWYTIDDCIAKGWTNFSSDFTELWFSISTYGIDTSNLEYAYLVIIGQERVLVHQD